MAEKVEETKLETETVEETAAEVKINGVDGQDVASDTEVSNAGSEENDAVDVDTDTSEPDVSEAAEETPTVESLQAELEDAQAEGAKNLEGWQRAVADLANYKRRQEEQSARRTLDLKATIIRDILPALDDLDLAFQNLPQGLSEQETSWVEGFKLVQRKLLKVLENNNIQTISSEGEFDPNLHEAVTYEESPEHESNTIIAELRKGYIAGDRVLRPALVRVAQ